MQEHSSERMKQMEQEAAHRLRELNKRAKPPPQNEGTVAEPPAPSPTRPQKAQRKGVFSFLDALDIKKLIGENSEQAMLLLLVLILANDNNCDDYLLYALIYIML